MSEKQLDITELHTLNTLNTPTYFWQSMFSPCHIFIRYKNVGQLHQALKNVRGKLAHAMLANGK